MKKSDTPRISVIIPVYEVEKFLHRCLESVLSQSFTDFEVLLIDDGSIDRSGELCDEFALADYRVKVFHTVNEGVTSARKKGVENSIGNYVCFVDSDDSLPVDSLNNLYASAQKTGADIVIGGYVYYGKRTRFCQYANNLTNGIGYISSLLMHRVHTGPVARLFKKELFDKDTFNLARSFVMGEDTIMNIRLAINAGKVAFVNSIVYNYILREGSVSKQFVFTEDYLMKYETMILSLLFNKQIKANLTQEIIHFRISLLSDLMFYGQYPGKSDWLLDVVQTSNNVKKTLKENLTILMCNSSFFRYFLLKLYKILKQ